MSKNSKSECDHEHIKSLQGDQEPEVDQTQKEINDIVKALPSLPDDRLKQLHFRVSAEWVLQGLAKHPEISTLDQLLKHIEHEMRKRGIKTQAEESKERRSK